MALRDSSCYTLTFQPNKANPVMLDLNETYGAGFTRDEPRYVRVTEGRGDEAYSSVIFDGLTGAKLASAGYTAEKAKKRRLQLHGPDEDVPFEFTGKINFEWTFEFEGNKFRWTREVYGKDYKCSIDRKPDPRVEICLAREASSKGPARLQILHYNIDRFPDEIKDLRGLETLLVASLVCLLDAANDRSRNGSGSGSGNGPSRSNSAGKILKDGPTPPAKEGNVPPVPARPEQVISEDDFEPENPNEILVSMTSNLDDHIARATNLLEDPSILFVVVRTKTSDAVQRALEVSLGVTRFRHREGLADLNQYVIEEEVFTPWPHRSVSSSGPLRPGQGPKVINLDDAPKPASPSPPSGPVSGKWSPPNIAIYLSTIELPDLKPGRRELRHPTASTNPKPKPTPTPIQAPLAPAPAPPPILPPKHEVNASASASGSGSGPSKRTSSFGKLFRRTSS